MGSNYTGDGFLFDMAIEEADSETVDWLGRQEYYQKWEKERQELVEKYPCIDAVLEGTEEISLTGEEHRALVDYLDIRQKMESAQRREYYRFGHVHAQRYRDGLDERNSRAAGRMLPAEICARMESDSVQI